MRPEYSILITMLTKLRNGDANRRAFAIDATSERLRMRSLIHSSKICTVSRGGALHIAVYPQNIMAIPPWTNAGNVGIVINCHCAHVLTLSSNAGLVKLA